MAISSDRASVRRVRLRWAATILLTAGALVAAGLWAPEVRAWRTESVREMPERETSDREMPEREVPVPVPRLDEYDKDAEVPAAGTGTFAVAPDGGPLLGGGNGRIKRVRVAVESNLIAELDSLAAAVDATLGDPRSWPAGGAVRFQRVPTAEPFDFTIFLVTRETAFGMCRPNGVDIRVDGVPYTSCRQVGKVVINLDRWKLSVPSYVDNHIPLPTYRSYVINHEVGHELGRGHVGCPVAGRPAPVMLTQTLGLQGCTPNPWPYP